MPIRRTNKPHELNYNNLIHEAIFKTKDISSYFFVLIIKANTMTCATHIMPITIRAIGIS